MTPFSYLTIAIKIAMAIVAFAALLVPGTRKTRWIDRLPLAFVSAMFALGAGSQISMMMEVPLSRIISIRDMASTIMGAFGIVAYMHVWLSRR